MKGKVIIDCDHCIEDIEISIEGNTLKEALNTQYINAVLKEKGWHVLGNCLCPSCKEEVGNRNCMNCKHMNYNNYNFRCTRKITEEKGITYFDGRIVSEYDTCKYFENKSEN